MCGNRLPSTQIVSRRVVRQFIVTEHAYRQGATLGRHAHQKTNLTFVISGQYVESFRGRSELCKSGTLRLLPAGEYHENKFENDSRYLVVEVDPGSLDGLRENAALRTQAGQIRSPLIEHLGHRLYREFHALDDLSPLVMEGLLFELLAETERHCRAGRQAPPWLKTVYQLLQERFADDLTLAEIAAAAGVHPVYLCREFKKRRHVTVGAYVRELRIKRACELLRSSQMPLVEIALQCGFADQSHFSVVFKKTIGTTPAAFRIA